MTQQASAKTISRMLWASLAPLALALVALCIGCGKRGKGTATSQAGERKRPTLDARGGVVDSDMLLGFRHPIEGTAGNGGAITVESIAGNVELYRRAFTFVEPTQTIFGVGGLTVREGEKATIHGAHLLSFVWVETGGMLVLENNTYLQVTGDVRIIGVIRTEAGGNGRPVDAPDLTIRAGGNVLIRGKVDISGARMDDADGGDGGDVYIVAGSSVGGGGTPATDERLLVMTGTIDTKGGSSDSDDETNSLGGDGGNIYLGSFGRIDFSGRLNSRAGKSFTNNASFGPVGGDITVVAVGDILFEEVREINASGGESSGIPGDAGTIVVKAGNGTVTMDSFDIECFGGDSSFEENRAGNGGTVSINGVDVTVTNSTMRVRGGDAEDEDVETIGGNGGTISLTATDTIDVNQGTLMLRGGNTFDVGESGGIGGTFIGVPFDVGGTLSFDGSVNIRAGRGSSFKEGVRGSYCVANADNDQTIANIIGINTWPLSSCSDGSVEGLTAMVNELDNDDATIRPATMTVSLDLLTARLFRIFPAGGVDAVLTVNGDAEGDIDIYVIDGDRLADVQNATLTLTDLTNGAIYFAAEENAPDGANEETLTVAAGSLGAVVGADGHFLLLVRSAVASVEDVTVVVE